ncbi:MAG: hypothetical protein HKP55_04500 [Gammaproteobacteria bacterium]|nr:hypothetical protein [Gammaproteobacteria bacterium]
MSKIIQAIFVLFSLVIASFTYSSINNPSSIDLNDNKSNLCEDLGKTESSSPETYYQNILQLFMESVARGELVLFDNVIYKDSLKPLRIECHYNIEEKSRTVRIYSVLLVEIYHPTAPEFRIDGITAVLDQYGNITEVIAHVGSLMP